MLREARMIIGIGARTARSIPYTFAKKPLLNLSHLCGQCKTKAEDGICQTDELKGTTPERQLRSVFQ